MNRLFNASLLTLSLLGSAAAIADESRLMLNVMLQRQLPSHDGVSNKSNVTFSVLVNFDKRASVSMGGDWKLDVVAKDDGANADLSIVLYAREGTEIKQVGSPRMLAPLNSESSYQWTAASGEQFQVTLTPRRASTAGKS
jgi:hypothetical protein